MKKICLIVFCFMLVLTGCGNKEIDGGNNVTYDNSKSLVLYFSATGTTEIVAKSISKITNSDIVEIIPIEKYTTEDLNYNNNNCRANVEQNDSNARPKIKNQIDIEQYDTIYIGYPIWWGTAPKIILSLLDTLNFDGKNVALFCTSGSTGIEQSVSDIRQYNLNMNVLGGKRFSSSVTDDEIRNWIVSLNN